MGKRGPKPKPAAMPLASGRSPDRDSGGRLVEPSLPFVREAPEQPPNLSPEAKAEWERIVPKLAALNILTPAHQGGLVMLCETWS